MQEYVVLKGVACVLLKPCVSLSLIFNYCGTLVKPQEALFFKKKNPKFVSYLNLSEIAPMGYMNTPCSSHKPFTGRG